MGVPQTPTPPHLYPQALQLKLYQAFIFSIPILFSIILFLLFYLFYLKRRASAYSAPPSRSFNHAATYVSSSCEMGLKGEIKDKFPTVLFDEELRAKDSQCCICLGEFELKEELLQVPSCKHVFHVDCIRHWLRSNSTCPLCRSSVISSPSCSHMFHLHPPPSSGLELPHQDATTSQNVSSQEQQQHIVGATSGVSANSTEHLTITIEGVVSQPSADTLSSSSSVVVHIQTYSS